MLGRSRFILSLARRKAIQRLAPNKGGHTSEKILPRLDDAKRILEKNNFPFEDLPNDRNDVLWNEMKSEFNLSLAHVSALKNAACDGIAGREYLRCYENWQLTKVEKLPIYNDSERCVLPYTSTFEAHRTAQQSYIVDKTAYIKLLVSRRRNAIFLRPRRSGKTITLTMLKDFYYGAANLFKDMTVYGEIIRIGKFVWNPSNTSSASSSSSSSSSSAPPAHYFPPCPVLHLDFSLLSDFSSAAEFEVKLIKMLKQAAAVQGISSATIDDDSNCGEVLGTILRSMSSQATNEWGKAVLLFDEYDMPLNLNPRLLSDLIGVYRRFFTAIKASDALIEYVYVTGIASYGMTGIFSGANNFENLSFEPDFEGLCGFTPDETKKVMRLANYELNDQEFAKLKAKYNGYSWCSSKDFSNQQATAADTELPRKLTLETIETTTPGREAVGEASDAEKGTGDVVKYFNPFLVVSCAIAGSMDRSYWVASSSESLFKTFPNLRSISLPMSVPRGSLQNVYLPDSITIEDPETSARTLLELGYATITACDLTAGLVTLDYPNDEIREYMKNEIVSYYYSSFCDYCKVARQPLTDAENALNDRLDLEPLFRLINRHDESIPSQFALKWYQTEDLWRTYLYRLLSILQFSCAAEVNSSKGRSDIEIYIPGRNALIVIELKLVKTGGKEKYEEAAKGALEQIVDKGYGSGSFARDNVKTIETFVHVALVADSNKRRLGFFAEMHRDSSDSAEKGGEIVTSSSRMVEL